MSLFLTRFLAAALAVLLASPVSANVVSGAASAARIPAGGFAPAGAAFAGMLHAHLQSGMFQPQQADVRLGILPDLQKLDLSKKENHAQAAPILHYLSAELGYDEKTFAALSASEQRAAILLAAEEASSAISWDASLAMTAANRALYEGDEGIEETSEHLGRFRGPYALYLKATQLTEVRKLHDKTAERVRALRRQRTLGKGEEIAGRLSADDVGVSVVDTFESDTKDWKPLQWERLDRELAKVRGMIAEGKPLRGEIGNIKFLSGPLSGLGEVKFGTNRTHRVFFRYHPKTRQVVFLRVASRETMNKSLGVAKSLEAYRDDAVLESQMHPPGPEIHLMKKIQSSDLDIRLNPR